MEVEWTITIGNILALFVSMVAGCGVIFGVFIAMRSALDIHSERLAMLGGRMINVENEMKELKTVLIAMAAQDERLMAMRNNITTLEERINRYSERLGDLERQRRV